MVMVSKILLPVVDLDSTNFVPVPRKVRVSGGDGADVTAGESIFYWKPALAPLAV